MILIWLVEMAAALWMIAPYTEPGLLGVLLAIGLLSGVYLHSYDRGAFNAVCGFGAGIVLLLAVSLGHTGALGVPPAVVGAVGVVLVVGSLAAAASGAGDP